MPSVPLPFEYSNGLYRICDKNRVAFHTKYLQFFISYTTPSQTLVGDALEVWILGSVAGNRNRPRKHLLPFWIISKQKAAHPIREERLRGSGAQCKGSKETQGTKFQVQRSKFNLREPRQGCCRSSRRQASGSSSDTCRRSSTGNGRRGCHRSCGRWCPRRRCSGCCPAHPSSTPRE